jgi:hypothetical protein
MQKREKGRNKKQIYDNFLSKEKNFKECWPWLASRQKEA